jgi:adenosylcobinamide-GDP ribazoletransferase
MAALHDEFHAFGNAVMFFTRIPLPTGLRWSDALMRKAATWYPAVGVLVGTLGAGVAWGALELFESTLVAAALSTIATMLLTGAFHEDGLADVCDAFFGGYTPERVLEIMKDSRVGSFGAGGLCMVLLTKVMLLGEVLTAQSGWVRIGGTWVALVVAHAASRAASVSVLRLLDYVRANDTIGAKSKPMATSISAPRLLVAIGTGLTPALLFVAPGRVLGLVVGCAVVTGLLSAWFRKRIGGYTGDCLGTVQQLTELTVLAVLAMEASPWN